MFVKVKTLLLLLAVPAASLALNLTEKNLLRYTIASVFYVSDNNAFSAMNSYNPQTLKV